MAQEIPGIGDLMQQGVLGVVLAISLFINYIQYKDNKEIQEKRISEAKEVRDKIIEPMNNLQTTINNITLLLQNIVKK